MFFSLGIARHLVFEVGKRTQVLSIRTEPFFDGSRPYIICLYPLIIVEKYVPGPISKYYFPCQRIRKLTCSSIDYLNCGICPLKMAKQDPDISSTARHCTLMCRFEKFDLMCEDEEVPKRALCLAVRDQDRQSANGGLGRQGGFDWVGWIGWECRMGLGCWRGLW